jgi:chromosome segregation ATPase
VVLAFGALAAAVLYSTLRQSEYERQAENTRNAVQRLTDAVNGLADAQLRVDESRLAKQEAIANLKVAQRNLQAAKKGTQEYAQAKRELERASLAARRAENEHSNAIQAATKNRGVIIKAAKRAQTELAKERGMQARLNTEIAKYARTAQRGGRAGAMAAAKLKVLRGEFDKSRDRAAKAEKKIAAAGTAVRKVAQAGGPAAARVKSLQEELNRINTANAQRQFGTLASSLQMVKGWADTVNRSLLNAANAGSKVKAGSSGGGVKAHARGGVFTQATLGVFGEAGPEAIVPLGTGPRATRDRQRVMAQAGLTGSGSGGIVVNQYFRGEPDMFAASRAVRASFRGRFA